MSTILIAAPEHLQVLKEREDFSDAQTFSDTEALRALEVITRKRPEIVALERMFAATTRGAALINRIKTDPALGTCEVRVVSHSGDYARVVVTPAQSTALAGAGSTQAHVAADAPAAAPPQNMDWHGTRRAARQPVRPGIEMQFDGNPAAVIDLSPYGAQVISTTVLRPNQKVRISLPSDDFVMRFRGTVVWAQFELTKVPQYRAGIEFTDADARALELFCKKNKQ